MANWVRVAGLADVPEGKLLGIMAGSIPVVLANPDGDVYALRDECSHETYPLSDGELDGGDVVCLYHGARFECASGRNKALPAVRPVKSFPVEIREGEIFIDVE
ncbi:MAG: non-heme iron oxygenase ferredoxin subunit [Gemmatimonadetes bacterium]|jgi:3-phenylpropionate/trans-cinnamate dioxygenase ferredoxin component|nr:non-heme iron oxygenase ferredoxin subunit [Gemmatimonadota bacterium]